MIEFRKRFKKEGQAPLSGVPEWMNTLLLGRGIDTPEKADRFLHPSLDDLYDPLLMQGMENALKLIRCAVKRGDRILIYGDYDADGICACVILLETLRELGGDVDFRIPSRHREGYGLNLEAVEEIAKTFRLLITVDCGISNAEEIQRAKELGLTVIVTDHHEIPDVLPPADAILDPLLGDYPFRRLCGAGVALKICQAMQGRDGVEKRLEIAALATVADIVPLMDENRIIVREGMQRMAETRRPGLRALMECAQVNRPIQSDDIGFRLGPRLNAAGRLENASQGVRLLMTRDEREAEDLAIHLEENNRKRQEAERTILAEALALFPVQVNLRKDRVIIIEGKDWNSGLIGLVAGKLCERFHHPVIVFSHQGENAVGSCRSIPDVNIFQALYQCRDLFLRFGGHEQAAGLTVPAENIPELRNRLNEALRMNYDMSCFLPVKEYDEVLPLREVTLETADRLLDLEPTGCGNPEATFLVRNVFVQEVRKVGKNGAHLRLKLLDGAAVRSGIGFGLGMEADRDLQEVDVLFRPERNEFNGQITPQMRIQAIRRTRNPEEFRSEDEADKERQVFLEFLQEMSWRAAKKAQYGETGTEIRPEYLLKERFAGICMTDAELREIYTRLIQVLREGSFPSPAELAMAVGQTEDRLLTALTAFSETKLLNWRLEPFSVRMEIHPARCSMTDSPLIRYLRGAE